jgi:PKD repeat protein
MKPFFTLLILSSMGLSVLMAQTGQFIKIPADMQIAAQEKSEWYGHSQMSGLTIINGGYGYAIRAEAGTLTAGDEITDVKFYSDHENYAAYGATNTSYTIKIYEGGSFDIATGYAEITACGSEVYTQDYTATTSGPQEVELNTAYTIGSGEFWVAIICNGTSILVLGADDPSTAGQYVYSMDNNGTDYWVANTFCTNPSDCTETEVNPFFLSVFVNDGGGYQETSDLAVNGFIDNPVDQNIITELELEASDSLKIYPIFANGGPDDATEMITITVTIDGTEAGTYDVDPVNDLGGAFGAGGMIYVPMGLLSADDMNAGSLEDFDVCVNITYAGIDIISSNNQDCLSVSRTIIEVEPDANFSTDNTEGCGSLTVNFTDESYNADAWEWTFDGGDPATSTEQNPSVVYYTAGNYNVTLTVTNTNSGSTDTYTVSDYIIVHPTYLIEEEHDICEGETYNWHGTDYEESGTYTATYQCVNTGCDSIYELNLIVNPTYLIEEEHDICEGETYNWHGTDYEESGTYTATYQCVNTGCDSIYSLNLMVNPLPQVYVVTGGGSFPTGGEGVSVGLTDSELGVDYTLILDGTIIISTESGTGSAIDFGNQTFAGVYTIIAKNITNACEVEMYGSAIVTVITLINTSTENDFSIYPNPSNGLFTIKGKNIYSISITDFTGKVILEKTINSNRAEIDLSKYLKAVYLLKVYTENGIWMTKIVIK